jgi:hypothetical protein
LERVVLRLQNEYDNQPGFIHEDVGISDAGLAHISGLRHLKSLSISNVYRRGGPTITDAGMVSLSRLSRLETLSLHNRGIRGPGLAQLQRLPRLRDIMLLDPELTDGALEELSKVSSLRKLTLWGVPNVTDDAVRRFISELPNCQVEYLYKTPQ